MAGFVGREAEMDLLVREAALAVEASSGRLVFIAGDPGSGKTALATAFLERMAAERPGARIARGRCLQTFGSADPYLPFLHAIQDLSDETTAGSVQRENLSQLVVELAPYWLSVVPVVGGLLSAGFATASRFRGGTGSGGGAAPSREVLFIQYLDLIKRLAQQAPLVLLLEDLHWADQSSIALLNHVSRGITALPVLIVGTLRAGEAELERHPITSLILELEREDLARKLELEDLTGDALQALLAAEFGGDVSEPLRRWVLETAGGNPLFASELVRLLKQSGVVMETKGEWDLTRTVRDLEVPRSAEAVIEQRVQRLEPEETRLLQYASVEGNEFNSMVLARLLEADELEVLDTLEKLERRYQLVRTTGEQALPNGELATTLEFRHALVQTVLYKQVLGKRRVLLHRKAGEIMESLYGGALESVAGKLARHFHQGRVEKSAYRYARMAAEAARRVYAHWEAEELFQIALEYSPGPEETLTLRERLGDIYNTVGYYGKAIDCFESALEMLSGPSEAAVRLRRKVARLEYKAGLAPAPVTLQRVRTLLGEARDYPQERCALLLDMCILPDAVGVIEAATEALKIAEESRDSELVLGAIERLVGVLIWISGARIEGAFSYLDRALEIVRQTGDPLRATLYHTLAGIAHAKLGHFQDALREFESLLAIAERIGDPRQVAVACSNLGCLMLRLGRYQEADQYSLRSDRIHERRDRSSRVQSLLNLAERARLTGDFQRGIECYQKLIEHAQELEYWTSEAVAHAGLGLTLLAAGRVEEARAQAPRVMACVADRERWFEDRDLVELFLARLEVIDGHAEEALKRLQETADALRSHDIYLWARIELERASILRTRDPEAASNILSEVIPATGGLQSPPLQRQIQALSDALRVAPVPLQQ